MNGRVALVTGSGNGIGRRIAVRLGQAGARVVIADRDRDAARDAAAEVASTGAEALAVVMDVTDEANVADGVAEAVARFGRLDTLVSNAGVQHIAGIGELEFSDWRRVVAVHLDGAFLTTRAAFRVMRDQGSGGAIVYMGSVHSVEASPLKAPYVAAKHGILGLARAVAREGAPHRITANVVCPGFVRTALIEQQIPEQAERLGISEDEVVRNVMLKNTVDGEFTTTDDVAEAVLFFCAFPTTALTGQSLLISHGWHMQ